MPPELREALEAAVTQVEAGETATPTPTETPAPVEQTPAPVEPVESEVKEVVAEPTDKPTETPTETPPSPAEAKDKPNEKPAAATEPAPAEGKTVHRVDRAPQSWKKEAKTEWATLPLVARQEIHRRELEVNRILEESANTRQFSAEFNQTVAPFAARLQSIGLQPMQAVGKLMEADYILSTANPQKQAEFLANLIQDYGVDLPALDTALAARMGQGGQQQSAPQQSNDLERRILAGVHQMVAPIINQQQVNQQRLAESASMTVEQMSLDPRFPYFEDVREDMADIMEISAKRGVELTLEQAYDKATKFNSTVSSQLQRESSMQNATQQHQQAQRAVAAASSVSGAPAGGGIQSPVGDGTLRGAIEAAFSGHRL